MSCTCSEGLSITLGVGVLPHTARLCAILGEAWLEVLPLVVHSTPIAERVAHRGGCRPNCGATLIANFPRASTYARHGRQCMCIPAHQVELSSRSVEHVLRWNTLDRVGVQRAT